MPLFHLRKTLSFCYISVITEDIYLKLGVCVHHPKSNPCYQGTQFNLHFLRIMPLFRLRLIILYQAPHSRALAPAISALVVYFHLYLSHAVRNEGLTLCQTSPGFYVSEGITLSQTSPGFYVSAVQVF